MVMVHRSGPHLALALLVVVLFLPLGAAKEPFGKTLDRVNLEHAPVELAATDVSFHGQILIADPSRSLFGPESMLWSESCHHLDLSGHGAGTGRLYLVDGATNGELEDLDIYLYDSSGSILLQDSTDSNGIGLHHSVHVPRASTDGYVCLSNGARAEYEFIIS